MADVELVDDEGITICPGCARPIIVAGGRIRDHRLPGARRMTACAECLDELVACSCGEMVRAGSGHDCEKPWGGYWMCRCGHCTRHHSSWWDDNGHSGMGCDRCDCPDCEPEEEA